MDLGKWSFGAMANVICFVQEEQCTNDRGIHEVKLGVYRGALYKVLIGTEWLSRSLFQKFSSTPVGNTWMPGVQEASLCVG